MTPKVFTSHIAKVREHLTQQVRAALDATPASARELARAAGVSNVLLSQIRTGKQAATPDVARKLAAALEGWGAACQRAAKRIRAAARKVPTPRTRGTR